MNKIFTTLGVVLFLFVSHTLSAQEKNAALMNATTIKKNIQNKTTEYEGKVNYKSKHISFENAEKIIVDEKTNTMTIFKAKNLKIINVKGLVKAGKTKSDFIVYNYKENTVIL